MAPVGSIVSGKGKVKKLEEPVMYHEEIIDFLHFYHQLLEESSLKLLVRD